jgi:hypothetical protein
MSKRCGPGLLREIDQTGKYHSAGRGVAEEEALAVADVDPPARKL